MFQSFPSRVAGYVTEELEYEILQTLPEAERNTFTEAIVQHRRDTKILLTPAERGEPFVVPRLMAQIQGELEFADSDLFMEHHDWSLLRSFTETCRGRIRPSIVKAHRAAAGSKKEAWQKVLDAHARVAQVRFTRP